MDIGAILARADAAFRSVSAYLNALVIALVILLAGFIIVRLVRTSLTRLFSVVALDDKLTRLLGRRRQYARSARTAVVRALYLVTMYLALRSLHLAGVAIALIVGVVVVIILVSFAIGAADLLPNILARSRLRARRLSVGDDVEIDTPAGRIAGRIVEMSLLDVQVRRPSGDLVFFPNASLIGVRITKRRARR